MQSINILYCANCGAANKEQDTICFACGKTLVHAQDIDEQEQIQTIVILENRYRLIEPVGKGGFATVYKAEDLRTKKTVAVKEITLKDLKPQEIIDATDTYHREIRFGETLKHPALPRVYAHFMDSEHWYIVTDFIKGQTLEEYRQKLPGGQLPLKEALSIALQLCDVLSYLHSRQPPIIFRDIKPDNIMRTSAGLIYLIDFGIARQFKPGQRRDTQTLGSPGYAAPEQYGSQQTTESSDIYSLGATLQALLTGHDPSEADSTAAGKPIDLPENLKELLAEMLARDPAQRPTSITSVQRRLDIMNARLTSANPRAQIPALTPTPPATPYYIPSTAPGASKAPAWSPPQKQYNPLGAIVRGAIICIVLASIGGSLLFYLISGLANLGHHGMSTPAQGITPSGPQVLNIAVNNNALEPLDPATVQNTQSMQIISMTSASLVALNRAGEVIPQLADTWVSTDNGYTWTFHLHAGLKFSDGSPLTSADVAYSLDRALDPSLQYGTAPYNLQYIKGADQRATGKLKTLIGQSILTPDAQTVVIKLSKNIGYFLYTLTTPCASVVKKALIDKYGAAFTDHLNNGGSSGLFQFTIASQQRIELVPNPYYNNGSRPDLNTRLTLTRVSFIPYPTTEAAYNAFQANQVSFVDNIPPSLIDRVRQQSNTATSEQLSATYLAMNYLTRPFDNIAIRQAFNKAIDKNYISKTIRKYTVIPTNHIIPQQDLANKSLTTTAGDATEAKQLLQQGMHEEGIASLQTFPPVTLTYPQSVTTLQQQELAAMQSMWKENLGITVRLKAMPTGDFYKAISSQQGVRDMQMWRASWSANYPDASEWTTVQFSPGAQNVTSYGQNHSRSAAHQQDVQKMLAKAATTQDQSRRMSMYKSAEHELIKDVAWLPLYQYVDTFTIKPNLHYLSVDSMGLIPLDSWYTAYVA